MSVHSKPCLCDQMDMTYASVEEIWLTEMKCRGVSGEEMIAELEGELAEQTNEEDIEFYTDSIRLLKEMLHS